MKNMLNLAKRVVILCSIFLPAKFLTAGTSSAIMAVSASVVASCTLSATSLIFGSYTYNGGSLDATSTVSPNCTSGTPYVISLDNGVNGSTPAARNMINGSNKLTYSIYQDTARTNVWGSTAGTNTVTGTGTGLSQSIIAYGRIFAGQSSVIPGTYTDTVNVTLTY